MSYTRGQGTLEEMKSESWPPLCAGSIALNAFMFSEKYGHIEQDLRAWGVSWVSHCGTQASVAPHGSCKELFLHFVRVWVETS